MGLDQNFCRSYDNGIFVGVENILKLKPLNLATELIFSLVDYTRNDIVIYFLATLAFFFVLNFSLLFSS